MGTKVFDNALDLITFTRASGGTALRRIGYGPELVTNGTFDTDTVGWTTSGAAGTIESFEGTLRVNRVSGGVAASYEIPGLTVGTVYKINYDVVAGAERVAILTAATTPGVGTITGGSGVFVATSPSMFLNFSINSADGTSVQYDNVSVKEVFFDRASDPLVLFNHPTNIPRIEYDASGALKGLLIEEARTNLLLRSEEFDNAAWTKTSVSITANAAVAPDGELTADLVTLSGNGLVLRGTTTVATTQYTHSVFVKKGTADYFLVYLGSGGAGGADGGIIFNLTTKAFHGTLGGGAILSYGVIDVGGGWLRLYAVGAAGDTSTDTVFRPCNAAGTGVSGDTAYIWGAQFEAGAFPTSYIPTAGATATRSADIASIPVSAFGYNQKAGSLVVESSSLAALSGDFNGIVALGTNSSNRVNLGQIGDDGYQLISEGGVTSVLYNEGVSHNRDGYPAGVQKKTGIAFNGSSAVAGLGGQIGTEDTSVVVPVATEMRIGYDYSLRYRNGHIKSIAYYPRRLSNAQLVELTS